MGKILLAFVCTLAGMLIGIVIGTLLMRGVKLVINHILK
jgi:hypothetical protein